VAEDLFPSREQARAAILAGEVTVDGRPASKPGMSVQAGSVFAVLKRSRFVSRGGEKLDGAIERLELDVAGTIALDCGASTGGFTDCLLQRGASHVVAVDVGYGQLAWTLRRDRRVTVMERQNIRLLTPAALRAAMPERLPLPDLATLDLSFIGLEKVFPALVMLLRGGALVVALVKPQFQVGRALVGKGGIVRRPELHVSAIVSTAEAARDQGYGVLDLTYSGLPGPGGNLEYFLLLQAPGAGGYGSSNEIDSLEKTRQRLDRAVIATLAERTVADARATLGA
jgi:23S rRNA (cytidine1920-2'-O)/16S rRNA (cytidine1409-2'-O)-methyltransferase